MFSILVEYYEDDNQIYMNIVRYFRMFEIKNKRMVFTLRFNVFFRLLQVSMYNVYDIFVISCFECKIWFKVFLKYWGEIKWI